MVKKSFVSPVMALLAVFAILAISVVGLNGNSNLNMDGNSNSATIEYNSNVCVSHLSPEGEVLSEECGHNVLYTTGQNHIKALLNGSTTTNEAALTISLCNATAGCGTPVAAASEAYTAYSNCGLTAAAGTAASGTGNGNWTVSKTFTSTCDNVITNSTRLITAGSINFAGNPFTLVTLQNQDQLLVTWNIWVT